MGMQIIFCLETDNKARTDLVYIDETINNYYIVPNTVKKSYVYMDGKGNYKSKRTVNQIKKYSAAYSKIGDSIVVYCIDTDSIQIDSERLKEFYSIRDYCFSKGYEYVWFCRDVEEVFQGKRIEKSSKVEEAARFRNNKKIKSINEKQLRAIEPQKKKSNILSILDKYLDRR